MIYFIRHLIETQIGRKIVNVRDVLVNNCKKCNKQIPEFFYGETQIHKELCVYKTSDIVEEFRNTPKGFLPKKCRADGCNKWKY
jgi:hypothetical protein